MVDPYPLLLEPILKTKVWGGRRLADFGKDLPEAEMVGESWEVADLGATMPSGGGGGAARSVITNGPLEGRTLNEALRLWGPALVGNRWGDADDFPLLVKLIDAREHLSVQVHPTPAFAAAHLEAKVKTESWFVIAAEPGAELYLGLAPNADRAAGARAVSAGHVPEVLRAVPAVPGECHHLPSGTIHALGAGVLVAEVQSPSDTTFRLYDWTEEYGRPPRELHIDAALDSIETDPPPPPSRVPPGDGMVDLVTTDRYVLRSARGLSSIALQAATCTVVMCLDGVVSIDHAGSSLALTKGSTAIVPASASSTTQLDATDGTVLLAELTTDDSLATTTVSQQR